MSFGVLFCKAGVNTLWVATLDTVLQGSLANFAGFPLAPYPLVCMKRPLYTYSGPVPYVCPPPPLGVLAGGRTYPLLMGTIASLPYMPYQTNVFSLLAPLI